MTYVRVAGGLLVLACLYLTSLYSYNLFHGLAEGFSIVVASAVFVVAWNTRAYSANNYVLLIGTALLFVAFVDLVHTLAYDGMAVFPDYDTDLPTQLWLVGRYLHVLALLIAPFLLARRRHPHWYAGGFGILTAVLLSLVFAGYFPSAYVNGVGLTAFKIVSEYAMCVLLSAALALLWWKRGAFEREVSTLLGLSIGATVVSELLFTVYSSPFGPTNMLGHLFKLITFYLVYKAVVQTALARPYALLFREIKQSEEALREGERQQRQIADVLQEALLTTPQRIEGVSFGHLYRPSTVTSRVGGDFYDVFSPGQDSVGIIIGDVSGHGLHAAAFTSLARDTIKAFAYEGVAPSEALRKTNLVTLKTSAAGRARGDFLTAFYGVLDLEKQELTYSAAGHPPAVIRRADGGTEMLNVTSPVIGVFPEAVFRDSRTPLRAGDVLVLYTDGLTECRADRTTFFGEEGVCKALESLPDSPAAATVPQRLFEAAMAFCGGTLADDLAILAVSIDGDPATACPRT